MEITEKELIVHLDKWEQFFSLIHKVRVPLGQVVSARENQGLKNLKLGWRLPGTHVPFVIAAGTFISKGVRQFVYRRHGHQTVVIDLKGNEWGRLIIGVNHASRDVLRINTAIATCPK
ncbi:hypothetical protein [Duganella fentianensis]|uniref:hypothetical protein n=1 Tax=Duganella fentianensis TaxID=2692177 RepID=UPI0035308930